MPVAIFHVCGEPSLPQRKSELAVFIGPWILQPEPAAKISSQIAKTGLGTCPISDSLESERYG